MIQLTIGQKAPAFTGKDQNGKAISLKDYLGKKVVIYFYPQDDTPTCTVQACNLRDNYVLLKKEGFKNPEQAQLLKQLLNPIATYPQRFFREVY